MRNIIEIGNAWDESWRAKSVSCVSHCYQCDIGYFLLTIHHDGLPGWYDDLGDEYKDHLGAYEYPLPPGPKNPMSMRSKPFEWDDQLSVCPWGDRVQLRIKNSRSATVRFLTGKILTSLLPAAR
jgi:hypothetical protein